MASNTAYAVQVDVIESGQATSVEEGALYIKDSELKAVVGGSEVSIPTTTTTPTTTTVNILPAAIEDWYNTPVTIISGLGANEYPSELSIIVESELTGTEALDDYVAIYSDNGVRFDPIVSVDSSILFNGNKNVYTLTQGSSIVDPNANSIVLPIIAGADIKIASFVGNPTTVSGTLRLIVSYKLRTFGA